MSPSTRFLVIAAKVPSNSPGSPTSNDSSFTRSALAASCTSFARAACIFFGFQSSATSEALGTTSFSSSTHFAAYSSDRVDNPVMFPPGRPRLTTSPSLRGSPQPASRASAPRGTCAGSFDQLVRPQQQCLRDRQPKSLRGFEVDHELELGGLLDGEVRRLGALQDLVDVGGSTATQIGQARSKRHKSPGLRVLPETIHRRQLAPGREVCYPRSVKVREGVIDHDESAGPPSDCR